VHGADGKPSGESGVETGALWTGAVAPLAVQAAAEAALAEAARAEPAEVGPATPSLFFFPFLLFFFDLDAHSPPRILARAFVFVFVLLFSINFFEFVLKITQQPQQRNARGTLAVRVEF
jgi:hypothetical protein